MAIIIIIIIIIIITIFVYLIAYIPRNLTLLTAATQGDAIIYTEGLSGKQQTTNNAQRLINRT